jgi:hypothetical protein
MLLTLGWTLIFYFFVLFPMLQSIQSNTGTRYEKLLAASNRPLSQRGFDKGEKQPRSGWTSADLHLRFAKERSFGNLKENEVPRPKSSTSQQKPRRGLRDPGPRPALVSGGDLDE